MELIEKAEKLYLENFNNETWFERAVFFSWACKMETCCKYCYMSALPKEKRTSEKVRSFASLLAETILCKKLGWKFGFLSGGLGIFDDSKILDLLQKINEILGEKVWVNIGVLNEEQILKFKDYIIGVVGSVEVLNDELHNEICPSKPVEPIVEMFKINSKLGLKNSMTLIVGLGETIEDFPKLEEFIKENEIVKIHIYGLNPQKGTSFENSQPPSEEYQAEWIAKTRIAFPSIDIQMGIWRDRVDRISLLLKAGANSVSKFPATADFGKESAIEIEKQALKAGRKFTGTLTKLPDIDWDAEVDELSFDNKLKKEIKVKLQQYLEKMSKA